MPFYSQEKSPNGGKVRGRLQPCRPTRAQATPRVSPFLERANLSIQGAGCCRARRARKNKRNAITTKNKAGITSVTTLSGSILRLALPNSNKLTPHIKMMSRASFGAGSFSGTKKAAPKVPNPEAR